MPDVTRRGFLAQVSVAAGVGIAGGLGLHKLLPTAGLAPLQSPAPATMAAVAGVPTLGMGSITQAGPMLVHIRDLARSEISVMVDTRELVFHDPELVSRLAQAAFSTRQAGG